MSGTPLIDKQKVALPCRLRITDTLKDGEPAELSPAVD